ncbi:MAG: HAD hydrolase family protein, partial [Planctomycetota bacterium]
DGTTLEHTPLQPGVGPGIVAAARDHDPDCIVHVEAEDRWLTDRHDPQLTVASAAAFPPDHIGPLDSFIHGPITKLMLLTPDDRLAALHDVVQSRFAKQTSVLICDTHMLQCVDPAVDKATAVARIADRLGIPAERSAAIGDAPNDLGMIRWAALGLAVGNAWPELIEAADHAVATNANDGVAEAIDHYVLD